MKLSNVEIVLVRPARGANVAAACRALKNMGLSTLWLVEAREGLPDREERALAYGAWDVLDAAQRTTSLREALSASTVVVGTTARSVRGGALSARDLAAQVGERSRGGRVSIVFGPEASGLTGEELALCHLLVHIPTDSAQPSLNLAQAVLLLAYELRLASLGVPLSSPGEAEAPPAPAAVGRVASQA